VSEPDLDNLVLRDGRSDGSEKVGEGVLGGLKEILFCSFVFESVEGKGEITNSRGSAFLSLSNATLRFSTRKG